MNLTDLLCALGIHRTVTWRPTYDGRYWLGTCACCGCERIERTR